MEAFMETFHGGISWRRLMLCEIITGRYDYTYIYIHGLGVCNAFIYACFVHTYIHKYEYILFIGMMVGASTHIQNHMFEDGDGPILPAQALEPEEEKVIFRVLYSNPSRQKLLHITPNAGRFLV